MNRVVAYILIEVDLPATQPERILSRKAAVLGRVKAGPHELQGSIVHHAIPAYELKRIVDRFVAPQRLAKGPVAVAVEYASRRAGEQSRITIEVETIKGGSAARI